MANITADNVPQYANDQIFNMLWGVGADDGPFLCECDGSSCTAKVSMSLSEYLWRRDRDELLYAQGHGSNLHRRPLGPG